MELEEFDFPGSNCLVLVVIYLHLVIGKNNETLLKSLHHHFNIILIDFVLKHRNFQDLPVILNNSEEELPLKPGLLSLSLNIFLVLPDFFESLQLFTDSVALLDMDGEPSDIGFIFVGEWLFIGDVVYEDLLRRVDYTLYCSVLVQGLMR